MTYDMRPEILRVEVDEGKEQTISVEAENAPSYSEGVIPQDIQSDAYYALLSATMFAKQFLNNLESDADGDDPLLAIRKRFHAPLHTRLDSALALASKLVACDQAMASMKLNANVFGNSAKRGQRLNRKRIEHGK